MFEPHIPLELVKEITEHLKSDPNDQKPPLEAIQVGKALSLVCREWCPVGQALRWDTLDVQLPLYPSLLEHFVSHPHLALYLRNLIQTQKTRAFDQVKHDEVHWTTAIVALLPLTPNLQHLGLTGDPGENGQEFLRAASSLPRLELLSISLFSENGLVLDKSIWLNGFPRLEYLKILLPHVTVLPLELAQTSSAPTEGRTKVSTLAAGWGCPATLESTFAEDFFSVFDPSTLLACNFAGSAVCRATFERLGRCQNLSKVSIALLPWRIDDLFSQLLPCLTELKSLGSLVISIAGPSSESVSSNARFSDVLASFPPNLDRVDFRNFRLLSMDDIPFRDERAADGGRVVNIFLSKNGQPLAVPFWRDQGGNWFQGIPKIGY